MYPDQSVITCKGMLQLSLELSAPMRRTLASDGSLVSMEEVALRLPSFRKVTNLGQSDQRSTKTAVRYFAQPAPLLTQNTVTSHYSKKDLAADTLPQLRFSNAETIKDSANHSKMVAVAYLVHSIELRPTTKKPKADDHLRVCAPF